MWFPGGDSCDRALCVLMRQMIPTIFHLKNECRNNSHDSVICSESFRTSSPFIYLLQLGNFTHVAHMPSGVKNHVGASSRKCSSVGRSSGHCLRGFSRMLHFFPTLGSGLNTASWSRFWRTLVIPHLQCSGLGWPRREANHKHRRTPHSSDRCSSKKQTRREGITAKGFLAPVLLHNPVSCLWLITLLVWGTQTSRLEGEVIP